jgi:hypothetical protein
VLQNGMMINMYYGTGPSTGGIISVIIDWNGEKGPNIQGEDVFSLVINGGRDIAPAYAYWWPNLPPGRIVLHGYCAYPQDIATYNSIFSN